jgi:hypothetical protein
MRMSAAVRLGFFFSISFAHSLNDVNLDYDLIIELKKVIISLEKFTFLNSLLAYPIAHRRVHCTSHFQLEAVESRV